MNCTDCRCSSAAITRAQGCPMKVIETVSNDDDAGPFTDAEKVYIWPGVVVCFCIVMALATWALKACT